jgi:hypothetical protein
LGPIYSYLLILVFFFIFKSQHFLHLSKLILFLKREYSVIAVVFFKFIIKIIKFISSCLVFQRRHLSKPKPKVEMGTQNSDIDYDWIPKEALQSKNDKRNKINFDR